MDQRQLTEAISKVDLTGVCKAVATSVGDDLGVAADRYAELMVDDVHRRAVDGTRRLVTVLVSKGVPWPRAIERASAVAGVPSDRLGLYPTQMAVASVDPMTLADRADRVLLGWVAKVSKAVPVGGVSKAGREREREQNDRSRPQKERGHEAEEFDENDVNRDALGRFAPEGREAEAESGEQAKAREARAAKRKERAKANQAVARRKARSARRAAPAEQQAAAEQVAEQEQAKPATAGSSATASGRAAPARSKVKAQSTRVREAARTRVAPARARAQRAAVRAVERERATPPPQNLTVEPLTHAPAGLFHQMSRAEFDAMDFEDSGDKWKFANGITFAEPLIVQTVFNEPNNPMTPLLVKAMEKEGWRLVGQQTYRGMSMDPFDTIEFARIADHYQGIADRRVIKGGQAAAKAGAMHATSRTYAPGVPVNITTSYPGATRITHQTHTNWSPHQSLGPNLRTVSPDREEKETLIGGAWMHGPQGVMQKPMTLTIETLTPSWTSETSKARERERIRPDRERPTQQARGREDEFEEEDVNRDALGRFATQASSEQERSKEAEAREARRAKRHERAKANQQRARQRSAATAAQAAQAAQAATAADREAPAQAPARAASTTSRVASATSRASATQRARPTSRVTERTRTQRAGTRERARQPSTGKTFPMPQIETWQDAVTNPQDSAFARHVGRAGSQSAVATMDMSSGAWVGDYTDSDVMGLLYTGQEADLSDLLGEMWAIATENGQGDPYATANEFIALVDASFPQVNNVWPTGEVVRDIGLSMVRDDSYVGEEVEVEMEDMEIDSAAETGDDAALVMTRQGTQFTLQQTASPLDEEGESLTGITAVLSRDVAETLATLKVIEKAIQDTNSITDREEEKLINAYIDAGSEVSQHTYYSTSRMNDPSNIAGLTRLPQELWEPDRLMELMVNVLSSTDAVIHPPSHDAMAEVGAFTMDANDTDRVRLDNRSVYVIASRNTDRWPPTP